MGLIEIPITLPPDLPDDLAFDIMEVHSTFSFSMLLDVYDGRIAVLAFQSERLGSAGPIVDWAAVQACVSGHCIPLSAPAVRNQSLDGPFDANGRLRILIELDPAWARVIARLHATSTDPRLRSSHYQPVTILVYHVSLRFLDNRLVPVARAMWGQLDSNKHGVTFKENPEAAAALHAEMREPMNPQRMKHAEHKTAAACSAEAMCPTMMDGWWEGNRWRQLGYGYAQHSTAWSETKCPVGRCPMCDGGAREFRRPCLRGERVLVIGRSITR